MIKLEFSEYQGQLKNEKLVSKPTEHYYEDENMIILLFKSREKWEYYTSVLKSDILAFTENLDINMSIAIDEFKINFNSNHIKMEDIK